MGGRGRVLGLPVLGFAGEAGPPAILRTDPPHRPVRHVPTVSTELVGEEPIPELGVGFVGVEDRVGQPGFVEDLPDEAVAQIEQYAKYLASEHGVDLDGPAPGQDETT